MRIFYIAGFFAPILAEIQKSAGLYLEERSVVWIPQRRDKKNQLDLNMLKSDLHDQAGRGATDIHICCYVFREKELASEPELVGDQGYVMNNLDAIKELAIARHPGLNITIERFKNARDSVGILAKLREFQPSRQLAFPESLEHVESWAQSRCADRLLIHPRAARGARESDYSDVGLVYSALALLAEEYWNLRAARPEMRQSCQQALTGKLEKFGLELSPSISNTRAGEQGEDYLVIYPVGGMLKRTLELHLKKGADRESRNCLRIYFFWDSENQLIVVGWLTSHLGTRAS